MKKIYITFLLFCVTSTEIFAQGQNLKDAFAQKVKLMEGSYVPIAGSNPSCSEGFFSTVKGSFDKGIHIGHDVFFGPFIPEPQEEGYCHVEDIFDFKENQLIQKTVISKCPKAQKEDAGTTTRILSFSGDEIIYQVKETKFICRFKPENKGKK